MKRVAILVETSLASGRDILAGISRFLHEVDTWVVFHQAGPLGAMNPQALRAWEGDGIVARVADRRILEMLRNKRVPVVDVLGNLSDTGLPTVSCEEEGIAGLAAGHFLERGFRNLAFFGLAGERWCARRMGSFRAIVQAVPGATCSELMIRQSERRQPWLRQRARLCAWLEALPKPLGLMVASDQLAPDVMEACRHLKLKIPEEVSIVGVDNDAPFCEVCVPRLSSIDANHEVLGYEAAQLLDRLMRGGASPKRPLIIPPRHVVERRSSDSYAVGDPALAKALALIRERACGRLPVDEVAHAAGLSRSVLQRRIRETMGETVLEVITRTRLARAKELLSRTDLSLAEVAERAGFTYLEYLGYVFRKATGKTPAQYRRELSIMRKDET